MRNAPTPRSVAAEVLVRVVKDGAFAAAALDAELDRNVQLDARDRALATELVYGTLRYHRWLEERLGRYAKRGVTGLDPRVRAILGIAAYQVLVLDRVPAFAAVSEAVSLARASRGGGERVSGFVNAVLRKLAAEPKPSPEDLASAALASADPVLASAVVRAIGREGALALFGGGESRAAPLGLRIEDPSEREAWLERLRAARPAATFELGRASPHAILAWGAGRITDLPGYREGAWTPQEEGSQVVGLALGARAGDTVLDACAGRGNKTSLLALAVGGGGAVDAADLHPAKLERLKVELDRLGVAPRATFAVDWSVGVGDVRGPYDRVLVDAPCSGLGTVRRRPELLLRRSGADLPALTTLQRAVLARAASLVRPGGRLVYSVCSVIREEAEDVIADAHTLGLTPAPFDAEVARTLVGESGQGSLRLLSRGDAASVARGSGLGTDGYFIASFIATKSTLR